MIININHLRFFFIASTINSFCETNELRDFDSITRSLLECFWEDEKIPKYSALESRELLSNSIAHIDSERFHFFSQSKSCIFNCKYMFDFSYSFSEREEKKEATKFEDNEMVREFHSQFMLARQSSTNAMHWNKRSLLSITYQLSWLGWRASFYKKWIPVVDVELKNERHHIWETGRETGHIRLLAHIQRFYFLFSNLTNVLHCIGKKQQRQHSHKVSHGNIIDKNDISTRSFVQCH